MPIACYLKRTSARGNFSYRRTIPAKLRPLWGKREEKVSLKTKHHPQALRQAAMVNTRFENKAKRLGLLLEGNKLSVEDLQEQAKDILMSEGIHPQQMPTTQNEAILFFEDQNYWKDLYLDTTPTEHGYNQDGTIFTDYIDRDDSDPYKRAYDMLNDKSVSPIGPTITQALDTYFKINQASVNRSPYNQRKHEDRTRRAVRALGQPDTPITEFSRMKARRHQESLQVANPTWATATLNRTITTLASVFTTAIREYELDMQNPWADLQLSSSSTSEKSSKRRSFTPEEMSLYRQKLAKVNDEARMIGLLMIHTGCRTMEAAGLTFGELKLGDDIPHFQIRINNIRKLKTASSTRDVPVTVKLHDELRPYLEKRFHPSTIYEEDEPVFPKYGRDGGMDPLSTVLNSVIRKQLKITDPNLVAYSARHTMKDKLRALKTPEKIQHSILGHGSRSIADQYGDGEPLSYLLDELTKADDLKEWGSNITSA
jgi:integrase